MEFALGRRRREGYNFCEIMDEKNDSAKHWDGHPASAAAAAAAEAPSSSTPVETEHMFDKVVTPSDVGKLNRLVIPKQHAEKYFPLDTTTHEKGLLLDFEDRTGKPWRFRYSYWNSSQSYVMTKGWSRFVKEKRLGAGDTVSFGRGVDDKDRLYIDWKRRPEIQDPLWSAMTPTIPLPFPPPSNYPMLSFAARSVGPLPGRLLVPPTAVYDGHRQNYVYNAAAGGGAAGGGRFLVFRSALAPPPQAAVQQFGSGGFGGERDARLGSPKVLDSVPVVERQAAAKRVRLFGVNLDCPYTTTTSDGDAGDSSIRSAAFSSSPSPSPKEKETEELSLDLDM